MSHFHQADSLTVSCPGPLCCEPGMPAIVNMKISSFEVRSRTFTVKPGFINPTCVLQYTIQIFTTVHRIVIIYALLMGLMLNVMKEFRLGDYRD